MLMQVADEFYPLLAPRGQKAIVHIDGEITIYADGNKLARVFNNILKNAMAYSDPNSTIEISAKNENNETFISFSNTGKTIPSEKLKMIFEKFYRLDNARSTQTGGAGLGLAISNEIVQAHGGTITATSSNEKTIFTVMLPSNS